jgi:hypothetical protein
MSGHISRLIIGESVWPRLSATIGIAGTESAVTSGHTCNDFRETSLEAMQSAWPCGKWQAFNRYLGRWDAAITEATKSEARASTPALKGQVCGPQEDQSAGLLPVLGLRGLVADLNSRSGNTGSVPGKSAGRKPAPDWFI